MNLQEGGHRLQSTNTFPLVAVSSRLCEIEEFILGAKLCLFLIGSHLGRANALRPMDGIEQPFVTNIVSAILANIIFVCCSLVLL